VDAVVDTRDQARKRLAQINSGNPGAANLQHLADSMEALRSRLVAVKEGGAITGETKLREKLGDLYGSINQFDGRPTQSQLDTMQTLLMQLDHSEADLQKTLSVELPGINAELEKQRLEPIKPLTREDWDKKQGG